MDSEPVDVRDLMYAERNRITEAVVKAMATAPSLKDQGKIIKKISSERLSDDDIAKLPGVLIVNDPHIYGLAIKMMPGNQKVSEETFNHELDHYNEGREHNVENPKLGISFGADREFFSKKIKKGNWIGFYLYEMPEGLTKIEQKEIGQFITSAPENLSDGDKNKLSMREF